MATDIRKFFFKGKEPQPVADNAQEKKRKRNERDSVDQENKSPENTLTKKTKIEQQESPIKQSPTKESPTKKPPVKQSPKAKDIIKVPPQEEEEVEEEEATINSPLKNSLERKPSFWDYQNRPPPPNLGKKEIPEGAPNCLAGKFFIITGVLDSLERDQAVDLIKKYGGGICKTVAKKLTHAIIGVQAGETKMEKLGQLPNVTILDEDGLFDLIRTSGPKKVEPPKMTRTTKKASPKKPSPKKEAPIVSTTNHMDLTSPVEDSLWTDKYKPKSRHDLIGNPGVIEKLASWLVSWKTNQAKGQPRAVLLSGDPGIGKTSSAMIITRECGFDPIEFNASDTRNKESMDRVLSEAISNKSVTEFFGKQQAIARKTCLVMDEVDGMSSGDRGGMAELISLIKKTKVPIICVCNDRSSPKVRSLANHCLDLRFRKPTAQQALPRLLRIAAAEGITAEPPALEKLFESTHGDIRQVLNTLQIWRRSSNKLANNDDLKQKLFASSKDVDVGAFDVIPKLFGGNDSVSDKLGYYFVDSSLVPLLVQENFLVTSPYFVGNIAQSFGPDKASLAHLEAIAAAAESLSDSDLMDNLIHKYQHWDLSTAHGILSTVRPASMLRGGFHARLNFPMWLGKNSSANKRNRLLKELHAHVRTTVTANKYELRANYLDILRSKLTNPLKISGTNGIEDVIQLMDAYDFTKEDWESLLEISQLGDSDVMKEIPSNVKAAFTRSCNSHEHAIRVARGSSGSSSKVQEGPVGETFDEEARAERDALVDEDEEEKEDQNSDDLSKDKMVKIGKPKKKASQPKQTNKKASKAQEKKPEKPREKKKLQLKKA